MQREITLADASQMLNGSVGHNCQLILQINLQFATQLLCLLRAPSNCLHYYHRCKIGPSPISAVRMGLSNRMMFCKHFFAYLNDLAAFSGYSVVYQS
jgi:hypothetical protein